MGRGGYSTLVGLQRRSEEKRGEREDVKASQQLFYSSMTCYYFYFVNVYVMDYFLGATSAKCGMS